jgi:hypothetical protein
MGMSEFERAQFKKSSTRVVKKPCPLVPEDPAITVRGRAVQKDLEAEHTAPLVGITNPPASDAPH